MSEEFSGASNIQVVCRFRPLNQLEKQMGGGEVVDFDGKTCKINNKTGKHDFTFDHVFKSGSKQADVFGVVGKPVVEDIFKGYNGTVFVYGQTGSGKSYTMMGPNEDHKGYCTDPNLKGMIPRMIEEIFDRVENSDPDIEFTIQISYIEIYLEKIRDLLAPHNQDLKIKEDRESGRGVYIKGATEEYATSVEEVFGLLKLGAGNRVVSSTRMNDESSRSHSIFIITIGQKHLVNLDSKTGKLYLVDLAGSEKVKKTGASGQTLEEAKNINKSLSALGMVINALTDGVSKYVPYRDSKLTRLLQDSLGGNSRTTLIINCSISAYNEEETISTLRFGFRAKNIKNKPKVNRELSAKELQKLLDKSKEEILQLKSYMTGLEEELKIYKKGGFKPEISIQEQTKPTEPAEPSTSTKEADLKRIELEEKLNEILPTVSKYREKCLQLEKELAEEKSERNKILDESVQLKDELNQAKEEGNQFSEDIENLKSQLKSKVEYLATAESYRNDLEKMIQLKTNECQEVKDSMKEEKRKLDYIIQEKESEIEELKKQIDSYSKQLNETRIQLLNLQSKQEDPDLELVMNFIDKKFRIIKKTVKKESDRESLRKRRESVLTLRQIKTDLKNIQEEIDNNSEYSTDSDSDEESGTGLADFIFPSPPTSPKDCNPLTSVQPLTAIDEGEYFNEEEDNNEDTLIITEIPESDRLKEALEKIKEFEIANKNLKVDRDALMSDLANRVEKVIGLEMQLDDITDKYNTLASQNIIKKYTRKIEFLERNLEQVTINLSQEHNEYSDTRMKLALAEKKIRMKEERISDLNNIILEQTQKAKKEADSFVEERSKLNDIINALRYELETVRNYPSTPTAVVQTGEAEANLSKLRRPLRGGGSRSKRSEEDEYFSSPGSTAELDVEIDSNSSAMKYATIRKPASSHHKKPSTFSFKELFFGKPKPETNSIETNNIDLDSK